MIAFVDADTHVRAETLRAAAHAIERGAVGGGAVVRLEPGSRARDRAITALFAVPYFVLRLAAGCFLYARKADLEAVGGFDERYFAGEEVALSMNLWRRGRFVIVSPPVTTSGRKYRLYSPWRIVEQLVRLIVQEIAGPVPRERLPLWYDGKREARDPEGR